MCDCGLWSALVVGKTVGRNVPIRKRHLISWGWHFLYWVREWTCLSSWHAFHAPPIQLLHFCFLRNSNRDLPTSRACLPDQIYSLLHLSVAEVDGSLCKDHDMRRWTNWQNMPYVAEKAIFSLPFVGFVKWGSTYGGHCSKLLPCESLWWCFSFHAIEGLGQKLTLLFCYLQIDTTIDDAHAPIVYALIFWQQTKWNDEDILHTVLFRMILILCSKCMVPGARQSTLLLKASQTYVHCSLCSRCSQVLLRLIAKGTGITDFYSCMTRQASWCNRLRIVLRIKELCLSAVRWLSHLG